MAIAATPLRFAQHVVERSPLSVALFFGFVGYVLCAALTASLPGGVFLGSRIYDLYFLSLMDGRLDLPPRLVAAEGHFTPDGRAYIYHGLAPLLTRAIAWPFVDLRTVSMALPTIVLFIFIGSTFFLRALVDQIPKADVPAARYQWLVIILTLMVFVLSPGIMFVVNHAIFSEPISVQWAMLGIVFWAFSRVVFRGAPAIWAVPIVGLCAALSVHARPHTALVLYAATLSLMALALLAPRGSLGRGVAWRDLTFRNGAWRHDLKIWLPVLLTLIAMVGSGCLLLALNDLRSGSPFITHGSLGPGTALQYGHGFLGIEAPDDPRVQAWEEHGPIHPGRVPANLFVYLFALPGAAFDLAIDPIQSVLRTGLGHTRIELPRMGAAFLWVPWFVLAAIGARHVFAARPGTPASPVAGAIMLCTFAAIALFTLSYMTITMRYRVELWPILAFPALAAVPLLSSMPQELLRRYLLIPSFFAVALTIPTVVLMMLMFDIEGDGFLSEELCLHFLATYNGEVPLAEGFCRPVY